MNITLLQLFERNEQQFRDELSAMKLPRDVKRLQAFMKDFFINKVSVDEYKKELSVTEVAMFNSVLKLVYSPFIDLSALADSNQAASGKKSDSQNDSALNMFNIPVLASTTAGGIIGGILLKTWGGVLFSIAGCALGMYLTSSPKQKKEETGTADVSLDVDKYIDSLKQICRGIDDVMENYQTSISNIEKSYENVPKPTLATTYRPLLDRLASLFVALQNHTLPDDIKTEFDKLYRTLKNQHYEIVGYSDATQQYYTETSSPNVDRIVLVKAAILENGKLLETGECLIPEKQ